MRKILTALAASALVITALGAPTAATAVTASPSSTHQAVQHQAMLKAAQRASTTKCAKGSGSYSGRCWKLLKSKVAVVVVEAIPLENQTRRKKANMHCSFSRTVSKSVEVGGSVSASVEAGVFSVVKVNVSTTVHKNVSQTATEASSAGGDITLKPGESVVCQRTYGHVIARVRQTTWSGGKTESKVLRAKIPAGLGVRIVD
jgi:hypothetical protein